MHAFRHGVQIAIAPLADLAHFLARNRKAKPRATLAKTASKAGAERRRSMTTTAMSSVKKAWSSSLVKTLGPARMKDRSLGNALRPAHGGHTRVGSPGLGGGRRRPHPKMPRRSSREVRCHRRAPNRRGGSNQ